MTASLVGVPPAPGVLSAGGPCVDPTALAAECVLADDVTVSIRGLVLHPTDPPFTLLEFNPWGRPVRAESETPRAWGDGAWSGAEWADAVTIPITVLVRAPGAEQARGTRWWLAYHQQLAQAFAPSTDDIALEFTIANPERPSGGDTFLVYGRPRLIDPVAATAYRGWALARAAFRALDPLIYSGGPEGLYNTSTRLPLQTGGLCLPVLAPFGVPASVIAGHVTVISCGTASSAALLRIFGPVSEPRVTLLGPDGVPQVLRYHGALDASQWLELDTRARTALLNGVVSRRGQVSGDWFLIPPGESEITYEAPAYNPDTYLDVTWRSAWIA